MSHKCAGAILTCEDFRLHQRNDGRNYIAEFIKSLGIDADIITRAGGVQDIIRPKEDGYRFAIIRDLGVSVNLHEAKTIYLINHEDCGAYGEITFTSRQDEIAKHLEDLSTAKCIIAKEFPNVKIELYFAQLKDGASDEFLIKEI